MVVLARPHKLHPEFCACRPCIKWTAARALEERREHKQELLRILFNRAR